MEAIRLFIQNMVFFFEGGRGFRIKNWFVGLATTLRRVPVLQLQTASLAYSSPNPSSKLDFPHMLNCEVLFQNSPTGHIEHKSDQKDRAYRGDLQWDTISVLYTGMGLAAWAYVPHGHQWRVLYDWRINWLPLSFGIESMTSSVASSCFMWVEWVWYGTPYCGSSGELAQE